MTDNRNADDAEHGAVAMTNYRSAVGLVTAIYGMTVREAWAELAEVRRTFAGTSEAQQGVLTGLCNLALDLVDELADATGEEASSILQRRGLQASGD